MKTTVLIIVAALCMGSMSCGVGVDEADFGVDRGALTYGDPSASTTSGVAEKGADGGSRNDYLKFELKNVLVTSY